MESKQAFKPNKEIEMIKSIKKQVIRTNTNCFINSKGVMHLATWFDVSNFSRESTLLVRDQHYGIYWI